MSAAKLKNSKFEILIDQRFRNQFYKHKIIKETLWIENEYISVGSPDYV